MGEQRDPAREAYSKQKQEPPWVQFADKSRAYDSNNVRAREAAKKVTATDYLIGYRNRT